MQIETTTQPNSNLSLTCACVCLFEFSNCHIRSHVSAVTFELNFCVGLHSLWARLLFCFCFLIIFFPSSPVCPCNIIRRFYVPHISSLALHSTVFHSVHCTFVQQRNESIKRKHVYSSVTKRRKKSLYSQRQQPEEERRRRRRKKNRRDTTQSHVRRSQYFFLTTSPINK